METAQILVVEDETLVAKDIQNSLRSLGYSVPAIATSGEDAIRRAAETYPDLALMDIVLKGAMDGVETAAYLREHLRIPVVYLTAYGNDATLERAKSTEPLGYILKPFDDRELHRTIELALYKSRMDRSLRKSQEWLSQTLQSIGDAVVATDGAGRVLFMNPAAQVLTGWPHEEASGRALEEVLGWADRSTGETAPGPLAAILSEGKLVMLSEPTALVARDGTRVLIDGCGSPVRGPQGEATGAVLVFRDVGEHRRAREELERANRLKSELLGVLSHDLKTPLNVISGFASMIREKLVKDQDEALTRIIKHAHDLSLMIDSLLEISRIEGGVVDVVKQETDLGLFFAELRSLYDFLLVKEVVLVWDYPPYFPTVMIDGMKLKQVLQNLINNAIKFTPRGKIRVRVRCAPLLKLLEVKVSDTGIGIPREKMALIFERFHQVEGHNDKSQEGVGLGLYIVKTFTHMLGGEVEVESTPGTGSSFTVVLPYEL